jgi:hypothetical protein
MNGNLNLPDLSDIKVRVENVALEDLTIDPRIQRPLDANKVNRIADAFVLSGVGVLDVSRRDDGTVVVLDGQHRLEVLRRKERIGQAPAKVQCRVFVGLDRPREAALFLILNNTTKPRAVDKFRVAGTAQDPEVLGINQILADYHFAVGGGVTPGNVSAVATLLRIFRISEEKEKDPNLLRLAVLTVHGAWGNGYDGSRGVILEGIAAMHDEYGSRLDVQDFISRLAAYKGGPIGLLSDADQWAKIRKMRPAMAVADILVGTYNQGRRASALPEWRRRRWTA